MLAKCGPRSQGVSIDARQGDMTTPVELVVPGCAAIASLVLLIAGGRLYRVAAAVVAAVGGGAWGILLAPSMPLDISPIVLGASMAVIAAVLAALLARIAILALVTLSLAAAAPVIAWHLTDMGDLRAVANDVATAAAEAAPPPAAVTTSLREGSTSDAVVAVARYADEAGVAVAVAMRRAEAAWSAVPVPARALLVGAALAGLLVGLLVGTFAPRTCAAVVTAAIGALLLIWSAASMLEAAGSTALRETLTPSVMATAAIALAATGLLIQLTLTGRSGRLKAA